MHSFYAELVNRVLATLMDVSTLQPLKLQTLRIVARKDLPIGCMIRVFLPLGRSRLSWLSCLFCFCWIKFALPLSNLALVPANGGSISGIPSSGICVAVCAPELRWEILKEEERENKTKTSCVSLPLMVFSGFRPPRQGRVQGQWGIFFGPADGKRIEYRKWGLS